MELLVHSPKCTCAVAKAVVTSPLQLQPKSLSWLAPDVSKTPEPVKPKPLAWLAPEVNQVKTPVIQTKVESKEPKLSEIELLKSARSSAPLQIEDHKKVIIEMDQSTYEDLKRVVNAHEAHRQWQKNKTIANAKAKGRQVRFRPSRPPITWWRIQ